MNGIFIILLTKQGGAAFKSKWGGRPNVDNWRRSATINAALLNNQQGQGNLPITQGQTGGNGGTSGLTYEDLYANLPITTEQIEKSNDSLQTALFELGKIYVQEIEDCKAGTETLEQVRSRFPKFEKMDEVLFNLYFCYNKNGETAKAAAIKKLMGEKFGSSNFTTIITPERIRNLLQIRMLPKPMKKYTICLLKEILHRL